MRWFTDDSPSGPYEMWMLAAQACFVENLFGRRVSFLGPRCIEGARPPLTVSIACLGTRSPDAVITVRGLPAHIRLKHESLRTQASKLVGASEVVIGDPGFDGEFFLGGEPFALHALFDAKARALALKVFGRRPSMARELFPDDDHGEVGIDKGALVVRFVDTRYPHPPLVPSDLLGDALALADRLADGRLEERLAETIRTDPLPAVRVTAIGAVRDERPRHPATLAALEAACEDGDPFIRLAAATAIGTARGRSTLLELASRTKLPDDVSARAVGELRSHLPEDQARWILSEALRARRLRTAAACIDTLSHGAAHADVIGRVLALEGGELALAAARGLGRCGSLDDVPVLRDAEARQPRNEALALACRSAIAAIHARQPDASPGQLSLAVDRAGRLSVPEAAGGELSLPDRRNDREPPPAKRRP